MCKFLNGEEKRELKSLLNKRSKLTRNCSHKLGMRYEFMIIINRINQLEYINTRRFKKFHKHMVEYYASKGLLLEAVKHIEIGRKIYDIYYSLELMDLLVLTIDKTYPNIRFLETFTELFKIKIFPTVTIPDYRLVDVYFTTLNSLKKLIISSDKIKLTERDMKKIIFEMKINKY